MGSDSERLRKGNLMIWYFYKQLNDGYGQPIFGARTDGKPGYISSTDAPDFNQAALQFAQWLNENGHGVSDGYSVINESSPPSP